MLACLPTAPSLEDELWEHPLLRESAIFVHLFIKLSGLKLAMSKIALYASGSFHLSDGISRLLLFKVILVLFCMNLSHRKPSSCPLKDIFLFVTVSIRCFIVFYDTNQFSFILFVILVGIFWLLLQSFPRIVLHFRLLSSLFSNFS